MIQDYFKKKLIILANYAIKFFLMRFTILIRNTEIPNTVFSQMNNNLFLYSDKLNQTFFCCVNTFFNDLYQITSIKLFVSEFCD